MPVARGCGRARIQGALYFEMPMSEDGLPVEFFILDSPIKIPTGMNVSAVGTQMFERNGIYHIWDHVGSNYYPNVADYVEETKRFGASRLLSDRLDFSKLSVDSRYLLSHSRAWVDNTKQYGSWHCPRCKREHHPNALGRHACCAGVWWKDVDGLVANEDRLGIRKMPAFSYEAMARPAGVTPRYEEAWFMSFPVQRVVMVSRMDGGHKPMFERVRRELFAKPIMFEEVGE